MEAPTGRSSCALESLPRDLLPEVLWQCSVEDVLRFKEAARGSPSYSTIVDECNHRISVKEYIGKHFSNPCAVLEAMSRNFVFLSGSRSLEFFVPGSCTEGSDWDFYVEKSGSNVASFLNATEAVGFSWLTLIQEIRECMQAGSGGVAVPPGFLTTALQLIISVDARSYGLTYEKHDPDESLELGSWVEVRGGAVIVRECTDEDDYPGRFCYIIRGRARMRGGGEKKVQLIVGKRDDLLEADFLHSFHSSCVQSFITAHSACHLYGKAASKRLTYQWPNNIERDKDKAGAAKYIDRGFNKKDYIAPPRGYSLRTGDDGEATILLGYNDVGAPDDIVECYSSSARGTIWCERLWGTCSITLPVARYWPQLTEVSRSWYIERSRRGHPASDSKQRRSFLVEVSEGYLEEEEIGLG